MAMRQFKILLFAAQLACAAPAFCAASACPEQYVGGQLPQPTNPKLTSHLRELCSAAFSVGYSGVTRTPLWSAEHITREHVVEQKGVNHSHQAHAWKELVR